MHYIVTKKEMQLIDAYSINKIGLLGEVLMERAALRIAKRLQVIINKKSKILFVVEGGNNGGDGLAAARILIEKGYFIDIYYIQDLKHISSSFKIQMEILSNMGVRFLKSIPNQDYDVIVDGIFGVGLSREIVGTHRTIIELLNNKEAYKVAIDIPSGIDATTGKILGIALCVDCTITFGFKKLGMFFGEGMDYCGKIYCEDIGFPKKAIYDIKPKIYTYDKSDLNKLPKRYSNSNKGTYGRVAVIAGSKDMSGAAFLCSKAAYMTGSGLVKIYTHETNRVILQSLLPEAIMQTYDSCESALSCIADAVKWASVIVVGPGIGIDTISKHMLYQLLKDATVPIVADADALNILSEDMQPLKMTSAPLVITPHMKEMSRLLRMNVSDLKESRMQISNDFAEDMNVTVVLKDARTIVTNGNGYIYLNLVGNDGMSTGGSGDILSGIIAGMIAGGLALEEATKIGVYIHGLAGDCAKKKKGKYAMIASDILDSFGEVLRIF